MNMKRNADPDILFPHDVFKRPPIAWIVEPKGKPDMTAPYLTVKREVAEKRYLAGDHVTPYHAKNEPVEEDEL